MRKGPFLPLGGRYYQQATSSTGEGKADHWQYYCDLCGAEGPLLPEGFFAVNEGSWSWAAGICARCSRDKKNYGLKVMYKHFLNRDFDHLMGPMMWARRWVLRCARSGCAGAKITGDPFFQSFYPESRWCQCGCLLRLGYVEVFDPTRGGIVRVEVNKWGEERRNDSGHS